MIKIIEIPQRSDDILASSIDEDILTVTLDGVEEVFDFSGLPEGRLDRIDVELLKYNPIVSAVKVGDILTIELLRPYSFEEKCIYEVAEKIELPFGGGLIG